MNIDIRVKLDNQIAIRYAWKSHGTRLISEPGDAEIRVQLIQNPLSMLIRENMECSCEVPGLGAMALIVKNVRGGNGVIFLECETAKKPLAKEGALS